MKRRYIILILIFVLIVALAALVSGCGNRGGSQNNTTVETGCQKDRQKDTVTISGVRSSTGPNAIFEQTSFGPQYRMWADEINQQGGVYIKSLDRRVPVELKVYDDGSEAPMTTELFEQIVASEKPDLVLAPEGTASLFACSPIAQKYDYLLLAAEGGAKELEDYLPPKGENTNTFSVLNNSGTQAPALVSFIDEVGVKSVFCVFSDDLHGAEYWSATKPELDKTGVTYNEGVPIPLDGNFDPDAIVKAAMQSGADAFLCYTYQQGSIPITMSAVKLGYNPKMYLVGPGGCNDFFSLSVFGDSSNKSLDGMIAWGAWNEKSNPFGDERARNYSDHFREYWQEKGIFWKDEKGNFNDAGDKTVFQDWWGHICYYSVMQILEQALGNAGELMDDGRINNLVLVDYIANNSFDTVMHPELRFTNNILLDDMYLGNIGQWQNGVFEVIDCDARRTAEPVYPKPPWPAD